MAFTGGSHQQGFVPGSAANLSIEVELTISARKLADRDIFSKSDPMCVVYVQPFGKTWQEHARTEVLKNCLNPDFATKIRMTYMFEEQQRLKFKLYDVDSSSPSLDSHEFLGEVECTLAQIVSGRNYQASLKVGKTMVGQLVISAEEVGNCREELELLFHGIKLKKSSFFSYPDPFLNIFRDGVNGSVKTLIHRTPYISDTRNPQWSRFNIPVRLLKTSQGQDASLTIQCFNYNHDGNHKLIGEVQLQMKDLIDSPRTFILKHPEKSGNERGQLKLVESHLRPTYSFLDYITSGTQINCTFAIDFTASNGHPNNPTSLHYIGPNPNYYELALRGVGEIIQEYDSDKQFPVLGFGARLPPGGQVSHEFFVNMNPNSPYCAGMDGVLQAYKNCIHQVQLFGPTNFAPVIDHVARFASAHPNGDHYFILLILTDGEISDMAQTKEAIVAASKLALSIIIVGIGNADFGSMKELDSDNVALTANGVSAVRDIVQFVPFNQFLQSHHDPVTATYHLAKCLLAEVPDQLVSYMKSRNIVPKTITR